MNHVKILYNWLLKKSNIHVKNESCEKIYVYTSLVSIFTGLVSRSFVEGRRERAFHACSKHDILVHVSFQELKHGNKTGEDENKTSEDVYFSHDSFFA